jgi:hypothetical protein
VARKRRAKAKAGSEDFRGTPSALLWAVVAVFLVLSLLFNFRTPVGRNGYFHTPDEGAHIAYVRYVAEQGRLPRFEGYSGVGYEAHQPPLYYTLAAQVWRVVGTGFQR